MLNNYSNTDRDIIASSTYVDTSSTAKWYNRNGVQEDPWVSITDHGVADSDCNMVYGEMSGGHNCILNSR